MKAMMNKRGYLSPILLISLATVILYFRGVIGNEWQWYESLTIVLIALCAIGGYGGVMGPADIGISSMFTAVLFIILVLTAVNIDYWVVVAVAGSIALVLSSVLSARHAIQGGHTNLSYQDITLMTVVQAVSTVVPIGVHILCVL